ncbi:uncharacterized protein FRV6_15938 [Fusarium oxysporum]|uniref:Uncharacterized protein n=1 Tax=Fusarium oxysporum TaxID=5507 RepID=A0A2H3U4D0_FUSOX|nr:uncharacterized protein FRV6_15938 [Fusarium oxysporum]
MGSQISIETSNDATAVPSAIFNGPGISITDATFEKSYYEQNGLGGHLGSAGIFTSGPFGIVSGGILTTGYSRDADENTYNQNADTQIDGSEYCGPDTANAAALSVELVVEPEYNGLSIEFILATRENFTQYDRSSPPLIMGLPAAPGAHRMVFAICDADNGLLDSGLMVKAGGSVDCDKDIKINYATTTTVGPTPFVRTIQASGTISGTRRRYD